MSTARRADRLGAPHTDRPASTRQPGTDRPTATFPTGQRLADQTAHRQHLADLWEDATPTELLPAVGLPHPPAFPRVSTPARPTGSREALDSASGPCRSRTKVRPVQRRTSAAARHLRAALAGVLIAAALLTGLQLYAAAGISSARQAALAQRDAASRSERAEKAEKAGAPSEQWTVDGTTTAAASPLPLPRCTTSPDTPLPCLATISADSRRAVVLEEDASLTALVRR